MKKETKAMNMINVDDFIREKKKSGVSYILWSEQDVKMFRKCARFTYHIEGFRFPHSFPAGHIYMGIKHFSKSKDMV